MTEWQTLSWTFIGGGNMAEALLRGALAENGPADRIRVIDPSEERRAVLADALGIAVAAEEGGCRAVACMHSATDVFEGLRVGVAPREVSKRFSDWSTDHAGYPAFCQVI